MNMNAAMGAEVAGVRDDRDSTFPQTQHDASQFETNYGTEWDQEGTYGVENEDYSAFDGPSEATASRDDDGCMTQALPQDLSTLFHVVNFTEKDDPKRL